MYQQKAGTGPAQQYSFDALLTCMGGGIVLPEHA